MKAVAHLTLAFLLVSCTSREVRPATAYEVINELWLKGGTLQDLENRLGKADTSSSRKAEYKFPGSRVPQMHFNFNNEGKLESALIFIESNKLDQVKMIIGCDWIEQKGQKRTADFIDKSHEGYCRGKPIRFSYFASLNSYQLWWEKK
jgi:hypothetical protein